MQVPQVLQSNKLPFTIAILCLAYYPETTKVTENNKCRNQCKAVL